MDLQNKIHIELLRCYGEARRMTMQRVNLNKKSFVSFPPEALRSALRAGALPGQGENLPLRSIGPSGSEDGSRG